MAMTAARDGDTRTGRVSSTQYASSFGDLGRATFDLSLSLSSSHQPEKVGLVTASISSGNSDPATLAPDCGSRGLANEQDAYLVLHAHATGVTRPREALLRLSISSIIDQAVVDDGEEGSSKLWRLRVLMEHFLDAEQVILLLRPRFQSDLQYTRQLSESLADILRRRNVSGDPEKSADSVTAGASADNASHGVNESSAGHSAACAAEEPVVKGVEEEDMAEEGEWRRGPDSPSAQRPGRRKRQRTHALASLPAKAFYSHKPGAVLSRLQSWLSQQYQLQQRPLPTGTPCSLRPSHPSAYRVFPKQAHAFAFHDQLAGLSPLASESESFSRNREQEHERPEQKERHVQALSSPLRLWAFQAASDGRRGFAVCSLVPLFMDMYLRSMPPQSRHVYEIIREGYPCRLYFDVEFEKEDNPGLDGDALLSMFLDVVARKLNEVFGVTCPQSCFLQLDSSTPTRFSRHVITHLPSGQLFRSSIHMARFLNRLLHDVLQTEEGRCLWVKKRGAPIAGPASSLLPQAALGQAAESGATDVNPEVGVGADQPPSSSGDAPAGCPVHPPCSTGATATASNDALDPEITHPDRDHSEAAISRADASVDVSEGVVRDVLFVDTSVYSRNRSFRLLGSRKHGKGTPCFTLHNARAFEAQPLCPRGCPPSSALLGHEQDEEVHWLLASLVVPYAPCGHHTDATASPPPLLYVPLDEAQQRLTPGPSSSHLLPSSATCPSLRPAPLSLSSMSAEGGRPSPFPLVDAFILSLVTQGGVQGTIRSWHYTFGGPTEVHQQEGEGKRSILTFQIGNNRWCANVGRAHRSNHIMMVADLRRGVVHQKCHDPECRQYRSGPIYLPAGVNPSSEVVEQVEFDAALAQHISLNPQEYP